MSGSSLASATNQRLDAARRMLVQSQQGEEAWLASSFESSALFQLRSALNGLLQEVQASYSFKSQLSVKEMLAAAEVKGISIPVLNELELLGSNANSWLSQLNSAYTIAFECKPNAGANSYSSGVELIGKGTDTGASTKHILDSLVEVVLRFREDAAEY